MPPRLLVDLPLAPDLRCALPPGAARHVQVLRLQPGAELTLFDGRGGEYAARVARMGRGEVEVEVGAHDAVERELAFPVVLAVGMPANDRMDFLVEKAGELGATILQPLVCERSVLRLAGERAEKKVAHWQGVANAAAEQSGRTRVMRVASVRSLGDWLGSLPSSDAAPAAARWLLAFRDARPLAERHVEAGHGVIALSGPEGGLSAGEEADARRLGFVGLSLGTRVLRADTAPLAVLSALSLHDPGANPAHGRTDGGGV